MCIRDRQSEEPRNALLMSICGDIGLKARVDKLSRAVMTVRCLVDVWQPPRSKVPTGCRLHRAAGDHVEVARHHRGAGLCRRCGTFRQLYGADPTPAVLRAWSKGQKPTAGQIADAVAAAKKKRKKKRRSA